ncbi:MSP7-like protein [Plasmodium sp. gorilla clade G2]|uniref:MSP7-like protein n=1 Tax=Plasmodium sp. gorilla clade G2 TaxID=880535 RepID=UPI000D210095|nr:MSP7-like protein [Plasmodium sp. gorilla clade G2]SOV17958.1 MSP7-like protein [Plasmodium sp. gorilla clade G2]
MYSKKVLCSSFLFLILLSVIFCSESDTNSYDENVKKNEVFDALNEHLDSISNIVKVNIMDALSENNPSLIKRTYEAVEINDDDYILEYVGDCTGKYGEGSISFDENKKYNYRKYLDVESELQKVKGQDDDDEDEEDEDDDEDDEEDNNKYNDKHNDNDDDNKLYKNNDKYSNQKKDNLKGPHFKQTHYIYASNEDDNETSRLPKKQVHKKDERLNNESKTNLRKQEHKEKSNEYPNNGLSVVQISIVTNEDFLRKVKERNKQKNKKTKKNEYDTDEESESSEDTSKDSYSSDPSTIHDENENENEYENPNQNQNQNCISCKQSSDTNPNLNNDNSKKEQDSHINNVENGSQKNLEKNPCNDHHKHVNQESLSMYSKDNMNRKNDKKNNGDLYNIKKDNDLSEFEKFDKTYYEFFSNGHDPFSMITTSRYENEILNDNYKNYNFNEQEIRLIQSMINTFIYTYKLNYAKNKSISKLFKDKLLKKNFRKYFTSYIYSIFNYGKTHKFIIPYNKDNDHVYRKLFDESVEMMDLLINKMELSFKHLKL